MSSPFTHNKIKRYKAVDLGLGTGLESIFYELKPLGYLIFSIIFIRSDAAANLFIKFGLVGIGAFALYIIFSRLSYRGYV